MAEVLPHPPQLPWPPPLLLPSSPRSRDWSSRLAHWGQELLAEAVQGTGQGRVAWGRRGTGVEAEAVGVVT